MSAINSFFENSWYWVSTNWQNIALLLIGIGIVYAVYLVLSKEVRSLKTQQKIEENVAVNLNRGLRWVSILIVLGIIIAQFGFDVGLVAGFMALAGGTIIGFASMSTLGNAIAGIIIMISKPFKIGDRILFDKEFADVIAIDLIYTRLKTLDNVLISIPNQQLLTTKLDNFGKKNVVRRSCSVTVGYDTPADHVEKALLEASKKIEGVLSEPKAYVWITNLLNFSIEYTLYIFTNQIKRLPIIDATMKRTVVLVCKEYKINLSTPNLIQKVGSNTDIIYD